MYETEIALSGKVEWSFIYQRLYHVHQVLVSRSRYIPVTVGVVKKAQIKRRKIKIFPCGKKKS
jgi:hypothetical protein